jgi:hypothetical protein
LCAVMAASSGWPAMAVMFKSLSSFAGASAYSRTA